MPRRSYLICALTCIAGIFGAFIRWLQNSNSFEESTSLAIRGSSWSVTMAVYLIAGALAFFFAVRYLGNQKRLTTGDCFPEAFNGNTIICNLAAILSLIFIVAGGVLTAINALRMGNLEFEFIGGVFAAVAGLFIFYILRNVSSRRKRGGGASFIIVVLFLCFRLIAEYKASAPDPVVWHYGVRILAISAIILAYYYLTGYCYKNAKPKRTLYFSILGVFLSIVTLADGVSFEYHLITAGFVLALLALTLLLTANMVPISRRGVPPSDE